MKLVNLIGQTFGKWFVAERVLSDRNNMTLWLCRCTCGAERAVYAKHLKSGQSKGCSKCQPRRSLKKNWKGYEDISGEHWSEIQCCANGFKKGRRKAIPFELTIQQAWALYLNQKRQCALSGLPIEFDYNTRRTASLDRIDSSLGYVLGNVQWVHKDINRMKNVYDQQYFVQMCKNVAAFK